MAGEIQLNSTTFATESAGTITVSNVDSATNRQNLGLEIGVDVQSFDADTTKNDVANTFTANQIISVTDNTNAALRVTQLGTGNALVVEDSTNPDSTPFVVDASGNVLVGTDSLVGGGERFCVVNPSDSGDWNSVFSNPGSSPFGIQIKYSAASPNGTGNRFIDCVDSIGLRFQIRSNGGIANYSANDTNLSDRREKTNFAPAKNYLETICSIPVQTFNYIDQNLEEDDGLTLGVIAQDVQEVAPELVMESNWGTEEEPKMRLSIYQTDLQYALMKSIQEQQTIIESQQSQIEALTARIEALENT